MPPCDPENAISTSFAKVALEAHLHTAFDGIIHEPIPRDLVIAADEGAARRDALRTPWGGAAQGGGGEARETILVG